MSLIPALLLCGVVLWLSIGEPYFLLAKRLVIRHEMKEKILHNLKASELTYISMEEIQKDPSSYWENDHEVYFQGEMYDVVRTEGKAYACVKDHAESDWKRDLLKRLDQDFEKRFEFKKLLDLKWYSEQTETILFYPSNEPTCLADIPVSTGVGFLNGVFSPPEI
ncbi:MAG: hypothetical protein K1X56_06290 [Flavobacteriales bacterium]|nr:hypothetical protein [Flavobacteriales bacterium]